MHHNYIKPINMQICNIIILAISYTDDDLLFIIQ